MQERLELILQVLKSARPIAEKNLRSDRMVDRIDEAIFEAERLLKATRNEGPEHYRGKCCLSE